MCIVPSRWQSNPCQHAMPSAQRAPVTPVWSNMHTHIWFYSSTRSPCALTHPDKSNARHPDFRSCHSKEKKAVASSLLTYLCPVSLCSTFGPLGSQLSDRPMLSFLNVQFGSCVPTATKASTPCPPSYTPSAGIYSHLCLPSFLLLFSFIHPAPCSTPAAGTGRTRY